MHVVRPSSASAASSPPGTSCCPVRRTHQGLTSTWLTCGGAPTRETPPRTRRPAHDQFSRPSWTGLTRPGHSPGSGLLAETSPRRACPRGTGRELPAEHRFHQGAEASGGGAPAPGRSEARSSPHRSTPGRAQTDLPSVEGAAASLRDRHRRSSTEGRTRRVRWRAGRHRAEDLQTESI
jgi:hypothetical protein